MSDAAERGEQARLQTGRQCGACSMCCFLFDIQDPQLTKRDGEWCPHCKPGASGCTIHSQRPQRCRNFYCQWLTDTEWDESWFPLKSRIVIFALRTAAGRNILVFKVDPRQPERWRQSAYFRTITDAAIEYLGSIVRVGKHTFVLQPSTRPLGPHVFMTSRGKVEWVKLAASSSSLYSEAG